MKIEFPTAAASGEGTNSFLILANYLDGQLSKLVLGQTGTTDTGQYVGTADAHENVRNDIETSDAVQLAATLNRDLVVPIVTLNMGRRKLYPRVKIAREKREDLAALVSSLNALIPLGLEVEESVMRDKLGLPEPAKGAKLLTAPAMPTSGTMPHYEYNPDTVERQTDQEPNNDIKPEDTPEVEAVAPSSALNGAQVTALMEVIQQVVMGTLPRASGIGIITAAFGLTLEEAESIMGEAGRSFTPTVQIETTQNKKTTIPTVPEEESSNSTLKTELPAEKAAFDWEDIIGKELAKVYELAENCQSHEDLKIAIEKLMAEGGLNMNTLGEDLAGKMFIASLAGAGVKSNGR